MNYHYTYRITDILLNKHYYGTRTSKNKIPKEDIGIYYFSSSSNKEFIKGQKDNPKNYKYKVIKTFNTRKEAIELEIKLHNKFNVGLNESFYNKVKQTSIGFDLTGRKFTRTDEQNKRNSEAQKGKILSKETREKMKKAKQNISQETRTKLKFHAANMTQETKNKISKSMQGKIHSLETRDKISKAHKGKILSEEHKDKLRKAKKNYKSHNTKEIHILDNNENIIFICFGNYKKTCIENNLPYSALNTSKRNNGSKIYNSSYGKNMARKNELTKYIGWSAKYVS